MDFKKSMLKEILNSFVVYLDKIEEHRIEMHKDIIELLRSNKQLLFENFENIFKYLKFVPFNKDSNKKEINKFIKKIDKNIKRIEEENLKYENESEFNFSEFTLKTSDIFDLRNDIQELIDNL